MIIDNPSKTYIIIYCCFKRAFQNPLRKMVETCRQQGLKNRLTYIKIIQGSIWHVFWLAVLAHEASAQTPQGARTQK